MITSALDLQPGTRETLRDQLFALLDQDRRIAPLLEEAITLGRIDGRYFYTGETGECGCFLGWAAAATLPSERGRWNSKAINTQAQLLRDDVANAVGRLRAFGETHHTLILETWVDTARPGYPMPHARFFLKLIQQWRSIRAAAEIGG